MITNLVYLHPVSLVAVRVRGPYSASATKAWDLMTGWLRPRGALSKITPRYGLLLDDPHVTAPTNCRYEACIALPAGLGPLPWGFSVKRLPYGAYTQARHVGGKEGIAQTISTIRSEWTSNTGLVWDTDRPLIEIYRDTPSKLPVECQRIDVCLPVMFQADQIPLAAQ